MVKKSILVYLSVALIIVSSCTGYEKLLKGTDYRLKYKEAKRYYAEEEYYKAQVLYDHIAPVFRGTEQADSVYFYQAMCYFKQKDYVMAGHYFSTFSKTYGGSPFVEEADYMAAYCYYENSPRPELDQENTEMGIQMFQLYLIKHGENGERVNEAKNYIAELKDKLVEKSFISAKLYYDLEAYKASLVALNNSLLEYPESKYREEIMFMILKSSYMFAYGSVENKKKERFQTTVDEYFSFKSEFPESRFIKDANKFYKVSSRYLEGVENNEEIEIN
jgi:outer membrane protein assembly factor BamD